MSSEQVLQDPDWLWKGRIPCLDGFRGVAIAMVLVIHLLEHHTAHMPFLLERLVTRCGSGVEVFFVISGFLITLLLLRERHSTGRISLRGFFARRAFRILPAYVAFAVAIPLFTRPGTGLTPLAPRHWLAVCLFYSDFITRPPILNHLWTLSIEEHFYLVFPFLLAASRRLAAGASAAVVLLTPVARFACIRYRLSTPDMGFWTVTQSDGIAVGCCLAFLATSAHRRRIHLSQRSARSVALAGVAGFLLNTVPPPWTVFIWFKSTCGNTVDSLLIGAVIWACACHPTTVGRLLTGRGIAAVGIWSYSLYLWQQPLTTPSQLGPVPLRMLALVPLALGSYYLIETPFLRLGARVRSRKHDNEPLSAATATSEIVPASI